MDPAWIALLGTLFGGVGLKVAEHYLGRNQVRISDATQIRDELRLTIAEQRAEILVLEGEQTKWRNAYYDLRDKFMQLQTDLQIIVAKMKSKEDNDAK